MWWPSVLVGERVVAGVIGVAEEPSLTGLKFAPAARCGDQRPLHSFLAPITLDSGNGPERRDRLLGHPQCLWRESRRVNVVEPRVDGGIRGDTGQLECGGWSIAINLRETCSTGIFAFCETFTSSWNASAASTPKRSISMPLT